MRKALLFLALAVSAVVTKAQPFGNEWITYDQPYWMFKVASDGFRRIDSTALANAGLPLATLDPRGLQLYARGRQVPLYVHGEEDGMFNNGDYIEFWAAKNDAWLDSTLWDDPAHINNPYHSLYNDTIRYYLTLGPPGGSLRTIPVQSGNWAAHEQLAWCWGTTLVQFPVLYQDGKRTPLNASACSIGEGEGYFNNAIIASVGSDGTVGYALALPDASTLPERPNSTYRTSLASLNNPGGYACPDHHLRISHSGIQYADTIFNGHKLLKYTLELPAANVTGTSTTVSYTSVHDLVCPGLAPDYPDVSALAWHSIRYPRNFAFANGGDRVEVPARPDSSAMAFTAGAGAILYLWAPNGVHRVVPVNDGGLKAVLPPSSADMQLRMATNANALSVTGLVPVNGSGYFSQPAQVPDSALIIVTHPSLMDGAQQYALYRQTNPHNRYNALVVDVEQLYDQFGGGVRQHPLAIRNYMRYAYHSTPQKPRGLFLLGKSVKAPQTGGLVYQRGYRNDPTASAACLVPTIGWPSADMLYGLDLDGGQPAYLTVPVGRLAARTNEDIQEYLAKVDSVEGQPRAAWMKNILHFRGGFTQSEWQQFDAALHSFQVVAEDTAFSGKVTKFSKNSAAVIEQAAADSVTDMIAKGVTLMTFFAHAYGGGFDITIDVPTNYNWNGKFPTILGNSCFTGDIHLYDTYSSSEQFVLANNAGAVAFLSSGSVGLSNYLQQYSYDFYRSFSLVNYGRTIGEHMRFAAYNQLLAGDISSLNSAETMTLHGDPVLVMNSPPMPDLEVKDPDVRLIPEQVTADMDSFKVEVTVRNIGRGTGKPFSIALERRMLSQGINLPADIRMDSLQSFEKTMQFTLPVKVGTAGVGLNEIQVRVDLDPDLVHEMDDTGNNQVTKRFSISSGDLLPVEPYDFAIVPDPTPTLKASTADAFAPARTYIFQIDTTDLYNSPLMEQHTVTAVGGVLEWQPGAIYNINNQRDSVVFFWRCTLDSAGQGGYNWHESSFQHISGKKGWGQAHFFQFKDDGYNLIEHDRPQRRFEYHGGTHNISCVVKGNDFNQVFWLKDVEMQEGKGCGANPYMNVSVVDPFDFSTWETGYGGTGHYYGQFNANSACVDRPKKSFAFAFGSSAQPNIAQMDTMAYMLEHVIPDGHFVLVHTYLRLLRTPLEQSAAMAALAALGASNLASGAVPDSVPYIFFCRKGDPASVQEVWGATQNALINMTAYIELNSRSGSVVAPRSNTALHWEKLSWEVHPSEAGDSLKLQLAGVSPQGNEQTLLTQETMSGDLDLDPVIGTQQIPQLRLKGSFWNNTSSAAPLPAQLKRWQLIGQPAPECAIDPPAGLYTRIDSLFQGQQAEVMVAVRNIGQVPMDSLLMTAWVTGHDNQTRRVHYKYNAPLAVGAVLKDTIRFSTQLFPGPNSIVIEANPIDTLTNAYDQPEQFHFNNIAQLRFLTLQDLENPVLDITFDGMHILDGDIVSAQPEIQITLEDENTAMMLNEPGDTAYFKVFLTEPSGATRRIYFREGAQEILQFVPASGTVNRSKVFYRPNFLQDGKYRIAVRASDKSRNNSGDRDNSVNFEVINRPTITEVLNYPNPFTTSTRFVFTLTGREVPTAMRIQIMTVAGRVVREIPMSELGPLRVGRNITDFAWDGTDQFGDRLARGVYLYRVMAQLNGQDIEYRDGGAGSFFTKGMGKMYLLR